MSAAIGIKGQPSRFAVLMKDSDSDDDEDELKTKSRVHQNLKGVTKSNKKGESAALKNAKKRARKKKNQSKGNHHEELHEATEKVEEDNTSGQLMYNDDTFEKDLQEALLISKLELEQREQLLAAEDHFKELRKHKKGIKLTLQELHCGEYENTKSPTADAAAAKQWPLMPSDDNNFFEDLSATVQDELQKEKTKKTKTNTQVNLDTSQTDAPRIADLKFQLEKRDDTITALEASVHHLNNELEEVKKRNQALCKILSKGEFSTKTELLKQVDQLVIERDELALENGELHKALEQEKSKNKNLTQELTKFQGSRHKVSSTSSVT